MCSPGLSWAQQCLSFQESAPFAVIGSNTVVEAKGQRVRGRLYPWGIVEGKHGPGSTGRRGRQGWGKDRQAFPTGMTGESWDCLCHLWCMAGDKGG